MKLIVLIALLISSIGALPQLQKDPVHNSLSANKPLTIQKDKPVWMLTYFRQQYPTRIEIDAQGKTVEVPLADPMLINKLHIAFSTDGRHWTPLNDNKPVWEHHMRDPYVSSRARIA